MIVLLVRHLLLHCILIWVIITNSVPSHSWPQQHILNSKSTALSVPILTLDDDRIYLVSVYRVHRPQTPTCFSAADKRKSPTNTFCYARQASMLPEMISRQLSGVTGCCLVLRVGSHPLTCWSCGTGAKRKQMFMVSDSGQCWSALHTRALKLLVLWTNVWLSHLSMICVCSQQTLVGLNNQIHEVIWSWSCHSPCVTVRKTVRNDAHSKARYKIHLKWYSLSKELVCLLKIVIGSVI